MHVQRRARWQKEQMKVQEEMERKGRLDEYGTAYSGPMDACAEEGKRVAEAMELLERTKRGSIACASTYHKALNACAKSGNVGLTLMLLEQVEREGIAGDVITEVRKAAEEMKLLERKGIEERSAMYSMVREASAKAGEVAEMKVLEEMERKGIAGDVGHDR
eukprot:TRINITY_DN81_c0_g1_i3.p4 TRINITY_DN81_c0_g1~~TRINITY_DN81_c0_g1_i3.p4  ORF type:complete len:162 (+),score=37.64 TRINITY_DN81_c0_g1_i3:205-690(+)